MRLPDRQPEARTGGKSGQGKSMACSVDAAGVFHAGIGGQPQMESAPDMAYVPVGIGCGAL
jgi:hypothetical protein